MKRIILLITVFTMAFCACSGGENNTVSDNVTGAAVSGTAIGHAVSEDDVPEYDVSGDAEEEANEEEKVNEAGEWNSDPDMTVIMAKKDGPMLSDKVDLTKKGIEMVNSGFATNPIKGDDGNCYYFRYQEEGKLTFYRNNAIKVCETVLPKKYEKDWYIETFLKQEGQFWVLFESDEYNKEILVPVQIEDGTWGKGIKRDWNERIIYYQDCFYSFYALSFVPEKIATDVKEVSISGTEYETNTILVYLKKNNVAYGLGENDDYALTDRYKKGWNGKPVKLRENIKHVYAAPKATVLLDNNGELYWTGTQDYYNQYDWVE